MTSVLKLFAFLYVSKMPNSSILSREINFAGYVTCKVSENVNGDKRIMFSPCQCACILSSFKIDENLGAGIPSRKKKCSLFFATPGSFKQIYNDKLSANFNSSYCVCSWSSLHFVSQSLCISFRYLLSFSIYMTSLLTFSFIHRTYRSLHPNIDYAPSLS